MKNILFSFALLFATAVSAQNTFYKLGRHTVSVEADNATHMYEYNNDDFSMIIFNTSNKYLRFRNIYMEYKDGHPMVSSNAVIRRALIGKGGNEATRNAIVSYFDMIITETDGEGVRKNINPHFSLLLTLAVNTTTGRVEEAKFDFYVECGFDEVSPLAYYRIERALIENISYEVTNVGKTVNYVPVAYSIRLPEKK